MAPSPFLVKRFPVPISSVVLGSFVLEPKEPRQGSHDPTIGLSAENRPSVDAVAIQNPFQDASSWKALGAKGVLSRLAKLALTGQWATEDHIKSSEAKEYTLRNSGEFFDKLITSSKASAGPDKSLSAENATKNDGSNNTRLWLEKALLGRHQKVYMVTAYRTLVNAQFGHKHGSSGGGVLDGTVPVGTAAGDPTGVSDVGGAISGGKGAKSNMAFRIDDEQIYEVQYRQVRLNGFRSHSVDDAYLQRGNCWFKQYSARGEDEDEEDEDAMDATLCADMDVPEGYEMVDDNGETLLFPVDD